MDYRETVSAMNDRRLREEYSRIKNVLHRGFRYGLGRKGEAEISWQLAVLDAELKARNQMTGSGGVAAGD